jgi:hypothetical protein
MTTIEWLQHCSAKRVILEDEFNPTNAPHKSCMFTTVMFDAIAYDYMESDNFQRMFDKDKYFAIYVNKVCKDCAAVKLDDDKEPLQFLKIIDNTPENRKRYGYQWEEP